MLYKLFNLAVIVTPTYSLVKDIMDRPYDINNRPVQEESDVLEVVLLPFLTIFQVAIIPNLFILLAMDQQQETITFSNEFMMVVCIFPYIEIFNNQVWKDPQLVWDGAEYNYTKPWLKLPEAHVWTPDVIFDHS